MDAQSKRLEFRVGLVSVVAIILLVAGILWGKRTAFGLDRQPIEMAFDNAAGISTSTPVFVHGVKVGTISEVRATDVDARVKADIDREVELYPDARAYIRVMELTGGKKIELDPGTVSPERAKMPLPGSNQGDIGELIAVAQNLATDLGPLLRRADSVLGSVSMIISDPAVQSDIRMTLDQFASSGQKINSLLTTSSPKVSRILASVDKLSTDLNAIVGTNREGIDQIVVTTNQLTGDASKAVGEARQLISQLQTLSTKLDGLASDVKGGEGMVSRLLYDEKFVNDINQTVKALKVLLIKFNANGVNVNMEIGHKH